MSTTITGLFDSPRQAAAAVQSLEAHGFAASDISVLAGEDFDRDAFTVESKSKMAEGAAVGAGAGGAIGALVAGFTTVGAVAATGGVGLLVAGPVAGALAGAGAGGVSGGILGGLVGSAIPEHEVKHYESAIGKGSVLIGAECRDGEQKKCAKECFTSCNAEKVSSA